LNTYTYHVITRSLFFVIIKLLILGIKIYCNMPRFLTFSTSVILFFYFSNIPESCVSFIIIFKHTARSR
jgi:hypothetical protein